MIKEKNITYGRCEFMKMYALISFDVPDDSTENFPTGSNVENYDVLKKISKEEITFDDCRFPYELRNLLMIRGIKKVADLEKYTLERLIRLLNRKCLEARQRNAYFECIIKTMDILGLSLCQNEENDLIKLDDCNLPPQILKRLNNAGYYYLQDIADSTQFGISRIKGIRGSQHIIEEKMKENGLWYAG